MNSYRVHYKKGDLEVEVESSDKGYVEEMLQKCLSSYTLKPGLIKLREEGRDTGGITPQQKRGKSSVANNEDTTVDIAAVANAIQESEKFNDIDEHVLKKSSILGRILLSLHFAHETGNEYLTTGDIEKITDQLGVKIAQPNVSNFITANRKYFSAGRTRRKGAKVPYKLNRQGKLAYEKSLAGEKVG